MVICMMIWMLFGICVCISDIVRLENVVIVIIVMYIIRDMFMLVVIVSVEQMFRICRVIGLLLKIGLKRICLVDVFVMIRFFFYVVFVGMLCSCVYLFSSLLDFEY